jgi:hypothetical protein
MTKPTGLDPITAKENDNEINPRKNTIHHLSSLHTMSIVPE